MFAKLVTNGAKTSKSAKILLFLSSILHAQKYELLAFVKTMSY